MLESTIDNVPVFLILIYEVFAKSVKSADFERKTRCRERPITKYLPDIISLYRSSKNYTNVGKLPCKITIAAI